MCGTDPVQLTASSGTIESPGYDQGTYPNNALCQWLITAPPGQVFIAFIENLEEPSTMLRPLALTGITVHIKQAVVRGTTNPAPCCHLCNWLVNASPLLPPSEWQWPSELWPVTTNNLTFDPPNRVRELTQNLIRSSHGHSTPSLKISCKSVQPFSRNVADKETNKQRNKERKKERNRAKTIPRPPAGGGVINYIKR